MVFGIVLGLCFGLVIRNYRALEIVKRCDQIPTEQCKFIIALISIHQFINSSSHHRSAQSNHKFASKRYRAEQSKEFTFRRCYDGEKLPQRTSQSGV